MSESVRRAPAQTDSELPPVQEPRGEIDTNRDERADSVDAVSSRLNMTAPARQKLHAAKPSTGHTLARAGGVVGRAKQKAPEPVQKAVDATGETLSSLLRQSSEKLSPLVRLGTDEVKAYRKQLLGAGGALLAAGVAVRRRKKRDGS